MADQKLIQNMTAEEKKTYFADVEKWTSESYPRLIAHVEAWTEAETKEFGTGLYLVSALFQARSFVAKADSFTHEQALSLIKRHLEYAKRYDNTPRDVIDTRSGIVQKRHEHVAVVPVTVPSDSPEGEGAVTDPVARQQEIIEEISKRYGGKRPKHYDEWKDLMSPKLRAEVEELRAYYLELAAAAEMSDKLDDDPRATTEDRAAANQRVVMIDDKIQAVHQLAEREWQALNGKKEASASEASPAPTTVPVASAKGKKAKKEARVSEASPAPTTVPVASAKGKKAKKEASASEASPAPATVPVASAKGKKAKQEASVSEASPAPATVPVASAKGKKDSAAGGSATGKKKTTVPSKPSKK